MKIGDLEITAVSDGRMVYSEPKGFPPKDSPDFAPHKDYITPDGRYLADLGAFLVRTGGRVVLLDAGMGPAKCGPDCGHDHSHDADDVVFHQPVGTSAGLAQMLAYFRRAGLDDAALDERKAALSRQSVEYGHLGASLARLGVSPDEITDVVLSHLHCDHVGWVSRRGRSYFPNADIWAHQADVDYFLADPAPNEEMFKLMFGVDSTKERMAPALSQLKIWDKDMTVAPGIDLVWLPGHTPGSSIAIVSSGRDRALMLGDVIHCPLEVVDQEFAIMGDMDPALASRSKERVFQELEDPTVHASSTHFPDLRFGRVLKGEGKKMWNWSN
jgi:glyoxylase-like metal-dependent hydrolase (beta-lactamase superfamily II)